MSYGIIMYLPEGFIIHAFISKMIILEIKFSEVWQIAESTYRDFLQFVVLWTQPDVIKIVTPIMEKPVLYLGLDKDS